MPGLPGRRGHRGPMRVLPLNVVLVPKGTEAEREGKSGGREEGERIKLRENVSGGEVIR